MPSYDVRNGKLVGAPARYQKAWSDFQSEKAPLSDAGKYRAEAEAEQGKRSKNA